MSTDDDASPGIEVLLRGPERIDREDRTKLLTSTERWVADRQVADLEGCTLTDVEPKNA